MKIKRILLKSFFILIYGGLFSQTDQLTSFTLNECITIALENNLDLEISKLNAKSSEVNYNQSRSELLPNLNMNYNLGINDGRSIDPFTNSYIEKELSFSNAGLNLSAPLFNGFKMLNQIKQSRLNLEASEMKIVEAKQNLTLEVTIRYIQILNNRDLLELAQSRLETTEKQLKRLESYYNDDAGNPVDYADIQGQYNRDEIGIINAETNFKSAILNLVKLLNIDLESEKYFENILGLVPETKYEFSAETVYNDALDNLATFKQKQLKIDAANKGIKVARSNYYPEVSFFGRLSTNYSSLAQGYTESGTAVSQTNSFVDINNQKFPVQRNETLFEGSDISYSDQFNNNLNSVVGVSVRVPLFNGFKAKNSVALQKIERDQNLVDLRNVKLQFKQSIDQAYNNMESAFNRYHVLLNQVVAFEESYRINEVRFNNGVSNIVDYIRSKNNMDTSRLNLNKTKYEYLLRVKILDFYRGF